MYFCALTDCSQIISKKGFRDYVLRSLCVKGFSYTTIVGKLQFQEENSARGFSGTSVGRSTIHVFGISRRGGTEEK